MPPWSELPSSLSYITVSTSSLFSPPLVYQTFLQSPVSTAPRVILKDTVQQCHSSAWISTCSVTKLCLTLCDPMTAAHQASLSFSISRSLLKLMSIELVMLSNDLFPCHPLLLLSLIFPSIRVFSNELVLHIRWPKYWSFSSNQSSQ